MFNQYILPVADRLPPLLYNGGASTITHQTSNRLLADQLRLNVLLPMT